MNKKVLTLCAGIMLASSVMASAAPESTNPYVPVNISDAVVGNEVASLPEGNDGSLYHLVAAGYMVNGGLTTFSDKKTLTLDENGTIALSSLASTTNGVIDADNAWTSSLWCVNVTRPEANGQNPIFDFTNSLRGMMLSVSVEGYKDWAKLEKTTGGDANVYYKESAPISDGEISGWKFYPVYVDDPAVCLFQQFSILSGSCLILRNKNPFNLPRVDFIALLMIVAQSPAEQNILFFLFLRPNNAGI